MSSSSSLTSSAAAAQGFHFTYTTSIKADHGPQSPNCTLHLLHVLPPDVYADQFQVAHSPAFSAALRGTADLELPVAAVPDAPSVLLLDIAAPLHAHAPLDVTVDVPLHLRYPKPTPSAHTEYGSVALPLPVGFWACPSAGAASGRALPAELLPHLSPHAFPPAAVYLIPHRTGSPEHINIAVPLGRLRDLAVVDLGTAAVMLLMFVYLALASTNTARRLHARRSKAE